MKRLIVAMVATVAVLPACAAIKQIDLSQVLPPIEIVLPMPKPPATPVEPAPVVVPAPEPEPDQVWDEPEPEPVAPPVVAPAPPVVAPTPVPAPVACEQLECVRLAAARYPELLRTNTFEACLEFVQRALEFLGPDWGHVGKPRGESQSVPKGFVPFGNITGVSHDAIKHRVTGQVVDLLGNASANEPCPLPEGECWEPGPASIQWGEVPPEFWRPTNPFVPAVPVR